MKHIRTCFHTLLDPGLDFRVRLFNILAIGGMAVSLIMVFCSLFMRAWPNACLNFLLALVSGGLFLYSYHSGHYQRCYLITIVLIFLIFFPVMFFTSGGYQGHLGFLVALALQKTLLHQFFNSYGAGGWSRSEERRVGKECASKCRSRWSPYH